MVRDKVRIRFRKGGDLRLVSHHDLMRCFERMLRRADIPFHATNGFNPKPRMVFALSLGLGIVGCEEAIELELDAELPLEDIQARLAREAPSGLEILNIRRVDPKTTAQVRRVCYRVRVPADRAQDLPLRIKTLLEAPECWIERTRPQHRRIDVRAYLRGLCFESKALTIDLWVTPTGSARPDEVLQVLGLSDLLTAGAVLERTVLELHDEIESPEQPLSSPRVEPATDGAPTPPIDMPTLIAGPLNFESSNRDPAAHCQKGNT